jgi:hypothetical protein
MANEQKPSWWNSVPGMLTAATGFVAALSGLVAGLNQLGMFRREEPAPQVVATAPAPPASTPVEPAAPAAGKSASSTAPAPAPAPKPRAATADSGAAAPRQLPKGTALELTVPLRTCAPAKGTRRVSARLAAPVTVNGDTLLPANTTAVLRLQLSGSRAALQVRLDSLVRQDMALAAPRSDVRLRGDAVNGACLRAHARLTVTLAAAVPLGRLVRR